jgi:hypothetical protein
MTWTLARRRKDGCVSDLEIDRRLLAELSEAELARLESHASICAVCAARIAEMSADREAFARPPLRLVPSIAPRRGRWLEHAAVAAAILFCVFTSATLLRLLGTVTRTKGPGVSFGFYVESKGEVRRGFDGEIVRPGDRVRFIYSTRAPRQLTVISVDARGLVAVEYAQHRAHPGKDVPFPDAIALDDTPGREDVFALFCERSIDVHPLIAQLERERGLTSPPGCTLQRVALEVKP